MLYFSLIVAFATFLSFASGEQCPPNSISLTNDPSICYSFHSTSINFGFAQTHCESFGANLITLKNSYVNFFVSQFASQVFDNTESSYYWTGGYRLRHVNFEWITGEKFDYENFIQSRQSNNHQFKGKKLACVKVQVGNGGWNAEECFKELPFICQFEASKNVIPLDVVSLDKVDNQFPSIVTVSTTLGITAITEKPSTIPPSSTASLGPCKDGWVYNPKTRSCYFSSSDIKPWKEAEATCQKDGAHLVSIHSSEENEFIINKLTSQYKLDYNCWENQIWMGFVEENHMYTWSDGTPNDFTDWHVGEPNGGYGREDCASIYSHTCGNNWNRQTKMKWNDFPCISALPYICKMPAYL